MTQNDLKILYKSQINENLKIAEALLVKENKPSINIQAMKICQILNLF